MRAGKYPSKYGEGSMGKMGDCPPAPMGWWGGRGREGECVIIRVEDAGRVHVVCECEESRSGGEESRETGNGDLEAVGSRVARVE